MSDNTTAPVMPKFNFAVTVDDATVAKEAEKRSGNWIREGEQELEILKVEYKKQATNDPSWMQFTFIMGKPDTKPGDDGKYKGVIYHNVMVPTQDITYQGKLGVFGMLQSLLAGFGVALTASNTAEVIQKYFTEFTGLAGLTLKVKVGYEGNHIIKERDLFYAVDRNKKRLPLSSGENEFANSDAAIGAAAVDGFVMDKGLKILRVLPSTEVKEPKSTVKPKTKKPVVTFDE